MGQSPNTPRPNIRDRLTWCRCGARRLGHRASPPLAARRRSTFVSVGALLETDNVSIYDEPKIDCHNHLLDPAHFGYAPNAWYHPVANEQGTAHQLTDMFNAYGSRHALVVGPNSGYDTDNRCLLDFLERGNGRFKGVAVVDNGTSRAELERLRDRGVVGTTMQAALLGVESFRGTEALLRNLADLDMFADVQVEADQLVEMAPMLEPSGVRVLIDHCGRPAPTAGLNQPGFRRLLDLASQRPVLRQDLRLGEVLGDEIPVGGFLAVRAGVARGIHAGSVHVGVGLAVPAGSRAHRLRAHSRPHRATGARSRRPPQGVVGNPRTALRL